MGQQIEKFKLWDANKTVKTLASYLKHKQDNKGIDSLTDKDNITH